MLNMLLRRERKIRVISTKVEALTPSLVLTVLHCQVLYVTRPSNQIHMKNTIHCWDLNVMCFINCFERHIKTECSCG